MDKNELAGILRDLVMLAVEISDVQLNNLSLDDYRKHCNLVEERIQKAFPSN